jgi:hypothetical protein
VPTENERRVEDLATGGKAILDEWSADMAGLAQRIDNDTLTVDDVVKYWAAGTKLALKGWNLAYSMVGDPVAKAAPAPEQAGAMAVSDFFQVQVNQVVATTLVLKVLGPLQADVGGHQVPVSELQLKPPELGASERRFRIQFPKGTHPKLIYRGKVEVRQVATGPVLTTIDVSVEVK